MDYSFEVREGAVHVLVNGRVDEASWERFGEALDEAIQRTSQLGLPTVVIDLSELDYMSSRGLRVLTVAKRQADDAAISILLASPNEVMSEILAISRYDKLFGVTGATAAKR